MVEDLCAVSCYRGPWEPIRNVSSAELIIPRPEWLSSVTGKFFSPDTALRGRFNLLATGFPAPRAHSHEIRTGPFWCSASPPHARAHLLCYWWVYGPRISIKLACLVALIYGHASRCCNWEPGDEEGGGGVCGSTHFHQSNHPLSPPAQSTLHPFPPSFHRRDAFVICIATLWPCGNIAKRPEQRDGTSTTNFNSMCTVLTICKYPPVNLCIFKENGIVWLILKQVTLFSFFLFYKGRFKPKVCGIHCLRILFNRSYLKMFIRRLFISQIWH